MTHSRAALVLIAMLGGTAAVANDKPPLAPDAAAPATAPASISAELQFDLAALDRALEQRVPRRLASFRDRTTSCWHRRIFGRMVNVDCTYSGYVERIGPISLRTEDGRLVATAPLSGSVSAQGTHRLARMLKGAAQGQMTVYATARPQLRPDWSVALDVREGFRWTEPPTLAILGFRINLERYVEPRIRSELARVKSNVEAGARALGIRGKAEAAWREAFAAIKIADAPELWLRTTPQSIAFSGVRAAGRVLEGAVEITGTTETVAGPGPAAPTPTPLPQLAREVAQPGRFEIIVPLTIGYDAVRQKVREAFAAVAPGGLALQDVEAYPSSGRLIVGLRVAAASGAAGAGEWVYLAVTPRADTDTQMLQLADPAVASGIVPPFAEPLRDAGTLQALGQQLRLRYQTDVQAMMASANAQLTRPLANGLRSEGQLTTVAVSRIFLLEDRLRVDLRASGTLKLLYGL